MGKPILLLRLEAPLQSWGTRSRWDVRDTAPEPTKSGVLGLVGCALGCPVGDPRLEKLDAALRFGVRVEHPGRVLVDYQTVTDYLPTADGRYKHRSGVAVGAPSTLRRQGKAPSTIVSPRAYLEDASFLAAFEQRDDGEDLLQDCALALQQPRWPVFLGRKACVPTRPLFEGLTSDYDDLEQALRRHPWCWLGTAAGLRRSKPGNGRPAELRAFVEVSGAEATGAAQRQDAIRTNATRAYGFLHLRALRVAFPGEQKGAIPCST